MWFIIAIVGLLELNFRLRLLGDLNPSLISKESNHEGFVLWVQIRLEDHSLASLQRPTAKSRMLNPSSTDDEFNYDASP